MRNGRNINFKRLFSLILQNIIPLNENIDQVKFGIHFLLKIAKSEVNKN